MQTMHEHALQINSKIDKYSDQHFSLENYQKKCNRAIVIVKWFEADV